MYKVLTGTGYDFARFVGIKREVWTRITGRETPVTDTQFAEGTVVINTITGAEGLILNPDSEYFSALPEPHLSRLVDVVDGDGWMNNTER